MLFIINFLILIFVPFLMLGIIRKTKAFWGGRKGASIFQPLFDFIKLTKKELVISKTTTQVFKIAPIINLSTVLLATLFVPFALRMTFLDFSFNLIVFAYILGLGKFFTLISAMDTGSSFEGMGASREAGFTTIIEPAFFMTIASIIAITGNYSLSCLSDLIKSAGNYGILIAIFAISVLFLMIIIECSRVPFDDPQTHLELTMVHEVMVLDNSGSDLALYTWANAIKMLIYSSFIALIVIPKGLPLLTDLGMYLGLLTIISILIGTVESAMARIRMTHIFEFVFITNSLALIVLSLVIVKMFGGQ